MVLPNNVLVVAAHPDDEVLGCGGTVARLTRQGVKVSVLILGEGITSREKGGGKNKEALARLKEQAKEAVSRLGVHELVFGDFPDNRFDAVARLDIIHVIEREMDRLQPEVIFTHHGGDLNIDHQITFEAVITAARPLPRVPVKAILAFEVLSSTEWAFGRLPFAPRVFVDISSTLERKIEAMKIYAGEIRGFPHPRSEGGIEALAKKRGTEAGLPAAEAFELVRWVW